MANKDDQTTPDGMWRATMGAFRDNLFFYKQIGTKIDVFHKELRHSGPFGWWGPLVESWVPANADSISISNTYFGPTAREAEAFGLGSCPTPGTASGARPSLECKLWAVGIGVNVTYDKPIGADPFPNPNPTPGAAILDVTGVRGRGTVQIGSQRLFLSVDIGLPPTITSGQALTSEPPVLNVGHRITAVAVASDDRITGVGGMDPDGTSWRLPLDAAVSAAELGHEFYVEKPDGNRVAVKVNSSASGRHYLKTEADGEVPDNLLALPRL